MQTPKTYIKRTFTYEGISFCEYFDSLIEENKARYIFKHHFFKYEFVNGIFIPTQRTLLHVEAVLIAILEELSFNDIKSKEIEFYGFDQLLDVQKAHNKIKAWKLNPTTEILNINFWRDENAKTIANCDPFGIM